MRGAVRGESFLTTSFAAFPEAGTACVLLVTAVLCLNPLGERETRAAPLPKGECIKTLCKGQRKLCDKSFRTELIAAKGLCGRPGVGRKECKKAAKAFFKGNKAKCRSAHRRCKGCCKDPTTDSCGISVLGDGICAGTPVDVEDCDGNDDARCPGACQPDCRCPLSVTTTTTTTTTTLRGECGDGVVNQVLEECDGDGSQCPTTFECVPSGFARECTCVAPCRLNPRPARVRIATEVSAGELCGCTLQNSRDTTCAGSSKIANLRCGEVLVGGGFSAAPPRPAPDGAMTFLGLPFCSDTELIMGPDVGEGPDPRTNCSHAGCFLGPPIDIVNNTAALSVCVINGLTGDLRGTINATTGHATMSAELNSKTFLTGDLVFGRCRGGPTPGKPCNREGATPRGDCAVCTGGANDGETCQDDTTGQCAGGANAFQDCTDDSDCPGGSCNGNCPGGSCNGLCADDVNAQCVGGANAGMPCTVAVCEGGGSPGLPCTADVNCRPGACGLTTTSICNGGANQGRFCDDDADCPGSTCTASDCPGGACVPGGSTPVQACPACVDDKFNPITDGSTGTCDLGANQGGACSSTNSEGLTIDCPPTDELAVADLPVTINDLTTGQATMMADADGTFCNFGFCEGGGRAGEFCNNSAECDGGTCHKTCQGGLDTNGEPLDGKPCQSDSQCAGLASGSCGQVDPGAFILGDAGGVTVRRIIENGQPASGPLEVGDVTQAKLATVFCMPQIPKAAISSAFSLPGPGTATLNVTFAIFGKCIGGADAGAFCRDASDCPGGTCG